MTSAQPDNWHKVIFVSPEGREEALWVEQEGMNSFRVLSVPVWAYGVSVGSIIETTPADRPPLRFRRSIKDSSGGTVRFVVPPGTIASRVYLERVIPDATRLGLHIGPATFLNPRLVAMHLHDRGKWWPEVAGYLDALVREGILEHWEVGDPDVYGNQSDVAAPSTGRVLVHPPPIDKVEVRQLDWN